MSGGKGVDQLKPRVVPERSYASSSARGRNGYMIVLFLKQACWMEIISVSPLFVSCSIRISIFPEVTLDLRIIFFVGLLSPLMFQDVQIMIKYWDLEIEPLPCPH